eukprot:GFYU01000460.1.p1 GENE.GFYU01000460.1~~GFYU01000460.1.p1  ORF type:complete len:744 (-),score=103.48 GFYU01000460.1:93-2324(-)
MVAALDHQIHPLFSQNATEQPLSTGVDQPATVEFTPDHQRAETGTARPASPNYVNDLTGQVQDFNSCLRSSSVSYILYDGSEPDVRKRRMSHKEVAAKYGTGCVGLSSYVVYDGSENKVARHGMSHRDIATCFGQLNRKATRSLNNLVRGADGIKTIGDLWDTLEAIHQVYVQNDVLGAISLLEILTHYATTADFSQPIRPGEAVRPAKNADSDTPTTDMTPTVPSSSFAVPQMLRQCGNNERGTSSECYSALPRDSLSQTMNRGTQEGDDEIEVIPSTPGTSSVRASTSTAPSKSYISLLFYDLAQAWEKVVHQVLYSTDEAHEGPIAHIGHGVVLENRFTDQVRVDCLLHNLTMWQGELVKNHNLSLPPFAKVISEIAHHCSMTDAARRTAPANTQGRSDSAAELHSQDVQSPYNKSHAQVNALRGKNKGSPKLNVLCHAGTAHNATHKPFVRSDMGMMNGLHHDLVSLIVNEMHWKDVVSLSMTCREMAQLCADDYLWMQKFQHDKSKWLAVGNMCGIRTWKERYIKHTRYNDALIPTQDTGARFIQRQWEKVKPLKVAFVGHERSGKQKILGRLLSPQSPATLLHRHREPRAVPGIYTPTDADRRHSVWWEINNRVVSMAVLSGLMWRNLFRSSHGLIYVMNGTLTDAPQLAVTRREIHHLLNTEDSISREDAPVLILLTDSTVNVHKPVGPPLPVAPVSDVAELLGLYALRRKWRVQSVSSNHWHGLKDGLDWLSNAL